jgi:hypothetical protein
MKKRLFLATAAIVAMTSCSNDEIVDSAMTDQAIVFSTFVSNQTKATAKISFVQGDNFAVNAYATETDWVTNETTTLPTFMHNLTITKGAAAWTYPGGDRYWPVGGKVSFFAHSPAAATGLTAPDNVAGAPKLEYVVPAGLADQIDLLVATPLKDKTSVDGLLQFDFKHVLSRIAFSAKLGFALAANETLTVTNLEVLYGPGIESTAKFDLDAATWTIPTAPFTADASAGVVFTGTQALTTAVPTADLTLAGKHLMLLPQTFVAGDIYVKLTYTATQNSETVANKTLQINLPAATSWEAGKAYKYALTISDLGGTKVEFDDPTITTGWSADIEQ